MHLQPAAYLHDLRKFEFALPTVMLPIDLITLHSALMRNQTKLWKTEAASVCFIRRLYPSFLSMDKIFLSMDKTFLLMDKTFLSMKKIFLSMDKIFLSMHKIFFKSDIKVFSMDKKIFFMDKKVFSMDKKV